MYLLTDDRFIRIMDPPPGLSSGPVPPGLSVGPPGLSDSPSEMNSAPTFQGNDEDAVSISPRASKLKSGPQFAAREASSTALRRNRGGSPALSLTSLSAGLAAAELHPDSVDLARRMILATERVRQQRAAVFLKELGFIGDEDAAIPAAASSAGGGGGGGDGATASDQRMYHSDSGSFSIERSDDEVEDADNHRRRHQQQQHTSTTTTTPTATKTTKSRNWGGGPASGLAETKKNALLAQQFRSAFVEDDASNSTGAFKRGQPSESTWLDADFSTATRRESASVSPQPPPPPLPPPSLPPPTPPPMDGSPASTSSSSAGRSAATDLPPPTPDVGVAKQQQQFYDRYLNVLHGGASAYCQSPVPTTTRPTSGSRKPININNNSSSSSNMRRFAPSPLGTAIASANNNITATTTSGANDNGNGNHSRQSESRLRREIIQLRNRADAFEKQARAASTRSAGLIRTQVGVVDFIGAMRSKLAAAEKARAGALADATEQLQSTRKQLAASRAADADGFRDSLYERLRPLREAAALRAQEQIIAGIQKERNRRAKEVRAKTAKMKSGLVSALEDFEASLVAEQRSQLARVVQDAVDADRRVHRLRMELVGTTRRWNASLAADSDGSLYASFGERGALGGGEEDEAAVVERLQRQLRQSRCGVVCREQFHSATLITPAQMRSGGDDGTSPRKPNRFHRDPDLLTFQEFRRGVRTALAASQNITSNNTARSRSRSTRAEKGGEGEEEGGEEPSLRDLVILFKYFDAAGTGRISYREFVCSCMPASAMALANAPTPRNKRRNTASSTPQRHKRELSTAFNVSTMEKKRHRDAAKALSETIRLRNRRHLKVKVGASAEGKVDTVVSSRRSSWETRLEEECFLLDLAWANVRQLQRQLGRNPEGPKSAHRWMKTMEHFGSASNSSGQLWAEEIGRLLCESGDAAGGAAVRLEWREMHVSTTSSPSPAQQQQKQQQQLLPANRPLSSPSASTVTFSSESEEEDVFVKVFEGDANAARDEISEEIFDSQFGNDSPTAQRHLSGDDMLLHSFRSGLWTSTASTRRLSTSSPLLDPDLDHAPSALVPSLLSDFSPPSSRMSTRHLPPQDDQSKITMLKLQLQQLQEELRLVEEGTAKGEEENEVDEGKVQLSSEHHLSHLSHGVFLHSAEEKERKEKKSVTWAPESHHLSHLDEEVFLQDVVDVDYGDLGEHHLSHLSHGVFLHSAVEGEKERKKKKSVTWAPESHHLSHLDEEVFLHDVVDVDNGELGEHHLSHLSHGVFLHSAEEGEKERKKKKSVTWAPESHHLSHLDEEVFLHDVVDVDNGELGEHHLSHLSPRVFAHVQEDIEEEKVERETEKENHFRLHARKKFDSFDLDGNGYLKGKDMARMADWVWETFHPGHRRDESEHAAHLGRNLYGRLHRGGTSIKGLTFEDFEGWYRHITEQVKIFRRNKSRRKKEQQQQQKNKKNKKSSAEEKKEVHHLSHLPQQIFTHVQVQDVEEEEEAEAEAEADLPPGLVPSPNLGSQFIEFKLQQQMQLQPQLQPQPLSPRKSRAVKPPSSPIQAQVQARKSDERQEVKMETSALLRRRVDFDVGKPTPPGSPRLAPPPPLPSSSSSSSSFSSTKLGNSDRNRAIASASAKLEFKIIKTRPIAIDTSSSSSSGGGGSWQSNKSASEALLAAELEAEAAIKRRLGKEQDGAIAGFEMESDDDEDDDDDADDDDDENKGEEKEGKAASEEEFEEERPRRKLACVKFTPPPPDYNDPWVVAAAAAAEAAASADRLATLAAAVADHCAHAAAAGASAARAEVVALALEKARTENNARQVRDLRMQSSLQLQATLEARAKARKSAQMAHKAHAAVVEAKKAAPQRHREAESLAWREKEAKEKEKEENKKSLLMQELQREAQHQEEGHFEELGGRAFFEPEQPPINRAIVQEVRRELDGVEKEARERERRRRSPEKGWNARGGHRRYRRKL